MCRNKPIDIITWCPDEDSIDKYGDRAFEILLCGKHFKQCQEGDVLNSFICI
jgi:hypothetical protein